MQVVLELKLTKDDTPVTYEYKIEDSGGIEFQTLCEEALVRLMSKAKAQLAEWFHIG